MAKRRNKRGNGQGTLFKRCEGGCWTAAWYDHEGRRKTRSTGTTDRAAAQRILSKWVSDAALRRDGVIDASAEATTKQGRRPIGEHLADWKAALESKGNGAKRVQVASSRTQRVVNDCRFATLSDVTPDAVSRFVKRLRDANAAERTINGYLQAFGQFIRWAVGERRLAWNPIAGMGSVKVVSPSFERRPLSGDELERLIAATEGAGPHKGLG